MIWSMLMQSPSLMFLAIVIFVVIAFLTVAFFRFVGRDIYDKGSGCTMRETADYYNSDKHGKTVR